MVNFTHDSMRSVMTLISLLSFSILKVVISYSSAYGVSVSQLIPYALVCSIYEDMFRGSILVSRLLKQGYSSRKLRATLRKFYGRHDLVHKFDTSVSHMLKGLQGFVLTNCDIWPPDMAPHIVTNLGCVRGQYHTNNEQTQSVEGII